MTQISFNLIDEVWIPCVDEQGEPAVYNLRQTLTNAHHIRTIVGESPLETAVLHRLLITILHAALQGPRHVDEWADWWEAPTLDEAKVNAYLDIWHQRFDLFAQERPFYQYPADERITPNSILNLNHDRASGNNATLFDHHTDAIGESLTPAQAARALITFQHFGLAGPCNPKYKLYFTDGTIGGGIVFLVEGDSLKETLLLNMQRYPDEKPIFCTDKDAPTWELKEPFELEREEPFGYLDYLTWQNRRILLLPQKTISGEIIVREMTMAPGLRLNGGVLDPMKHYRPDDKLGHVAMSLNENKVLWRDSSVLLTFHPQIEGNARPPTTFAWLSRLVYEGILPAEKTYRIIAYAMAKNQAKVSFFREERLPLPLAFLNRKDLVGQLTSGLEQASTIASDLQFSARLVGMIILLKKLEKDGKSQTVWEAWKGLNSNQKSDINNWVRHTNLMRDFWSQLDLPFQSFVEALALPQNEIRATDAWQTILRHTALDAFATLTQYTNQDPYARKAIVNGLSYLKGCLHKTIPQKEVVS